MSQKKKIFLVSQFNYLFKTQKHMAYITRYLDKSLGEELI